MSTDVDAEQFVERLQSYTSPAELKKFERYFKLDVSTGVTQDDDIFIGVRMAQVFGLAKEFIDMEPDEIEKLLESPIHEVRVGGLSIMDKQARRKKTPESRRKELYDLYLRRHDRVNNWDLVDVASPHVIGGYLADKPRDILYRLARSEDPWERRTAIVSCLYFIRHGDVDDCFKLGEILVYDGHDLVQKATGGLLREAGKKDRKQLLSFLDQYAATMPRTSLRYAIEHLDKDQRAHYLGLKKQAG
jgi:3-methyladenine DNA glycosylase AlkD